MDLAAFAKEHLWTVSLLGLAFMTLVSLLRTRATSKHLLDELQSLRSLKTQALQRAESVALGTSDTLNEKPSDPLMDELIQMQRLVGDATHQSNDDGRIVTGDTFALEEHTQTPPPRPLGWLKGLGIVLLVAGLAALIFREGLLFSASFFLSDPTANTELPVALFWKAAAIAAFGLMCAVTTSVAKSHVSRLQRDVASEREAMVGYQTLAAYERVLGHG